jgi:ATP-binding protein involved in chromosome partitioning
MEARVSVIDKRLKNIKRIISVASGKGGVGKSLVASNLALNLAEKGFKVGLLDLDLYGPSSHIILGVKDVFPEEKKGIVPPIIHDIKFMSIIYFTEDKPSAFRGIDITNIIIEILAITQWGSLDYLIIDMPPGIGDETLDVIRFIKRGEFLVISTASKVSIGAVLKLLKILKELKIPMIGILENMKMNGSSSVEDIATKLKIPFIGSITYDKNLEGAIGEPNLLLKSRFIEELNENLKKTNF